MFPKTQNTGRKGETESELGAQIEKNIIFRPTKGNFPARLSSPVTVYGSERIRQGKKRVLETCDRKKEGKRRKERGKVC